MPDVSVSIGGRTFEVACQDGEEHFLHTAAALLDVEARSLLNEIGRMPESRMLLMAGLMLADKAAATDDQIRELTANLAASERALAEARSRPTPPPGRVEVPVLPAGVLETMAEIAARTEALADAVEERSA